MNESTWTNGYKGDIVCLLQLVESLKESVGILGAITSSHFIFGKLSFSLTSDPLRPSPPPTFFNGLVVFYFCGTLWSLLPHHCSFKWWISFSGWLKWEQWRGRGEGPLENDSWVLCYYSHRAWSQIIFRIVVVVPEVWSSDLC